MKDETIIRAMDVLNANDKVVAFMEVRYMRRKMIAHVNIMTSDGTLYKISYNVNRNVDEQKYQFTAIDEFKIKQRALWQNILKNRSRKGDNCIVRENGSEHRLTQDDCENAILSGVFDTIMNVNPLGGFLFLNGETGNLEYVAAKES